MPVYKIALLFSLTGLVACSTQNWYSGAQSAQTAHCMKQPQAEYDDCMQQSGKSYNEYEKDQEELIREAAPAEQ